MTARRYELSDIQWAKIGSLLPGKAGDPGRTGSDYRLFINGCLWILRSGAHWRDLPERYGKWKTLHKRFSRWRHAGIWEQVFETLTTDRDNQFLMIDSTIVRAYQQAATGLSLVVQETLKHDPMCGHLFVFRGRDSGLIKVIWHDGQGACLFTKKLERGRFIWTSAADGSVVITPAQLGYLLEGIDWRMPQKTWRPTSAG